MKISLIHLRMTIVLLCCVLLNAKAQQVHQVVQADSSIFSKPLKIEATVKTERVPRSEQKGDTLIFNAAAYQVIENADSERLISKMPGISVSDGGVEANGKEVVRVLLDDQEFFGNDVLTALRNVPADMVKQIEVINRLSDSAQLTGVDDGEGYTAINIATKRKKGTGLTNGRVYGSYGLSDMADHRHNYIAGGNATSFTDRRTISVIGMSNNISKFNFSNSEIVSGSTNLDASGGSSFKVKALSGISNVHSLGANYTSKTTNLSYFFSDISNRNNPLSEQFTMTNEEGKELSTTRDNDYRAHNATHKLNGKITLRPHKRHTIIISPTISFEDLSNDRNLFGLYRYVYTDKEDKFVRKQTNINDNDRFVLRAAGAVNYIYRFNKRRRSMSLYGRYGFNWQKGTYRSWEYRWNKQDADTSDLESANKTNIQDRFQNSTQHVGTAKITYTEPLGKRSMLSGEYQFTVNDTDEELFITSRRMRA